MTLERRTPLRADPAKVRDWKRRTAKRLNPQSRKRAAEADTRRRTREAVFARDGHRCRMREIGAGPCFGPLTPHHVRKASAGGPYTVENLATLCAHHNGAIEADADIAALARRLGLVKLHDDALDSST